MSLRNIGAELPEHKGENYAQFIVRKRRRHTLDSVLPQQAVNVSIGTKLAGHPTSSIFVVGVWR